MLKLKKLLPVANNNRGVTIVIVAIFLVVLIGFVALAVDVGYMYVTRNELQNVADAAAVWRVPYGFGLRDSLLFKSTETMLSRVTKFLR